MCVLQGVSASLRYSRQSPPFFQGDNGSLWLSSNIDNVLFTIPDHEPRTTNPQRSASRRRAAMTDSATTPNSSPYPGELSVGGVTLTRTPDQLYLEFSDSMPIPEIEVLLDRYRLGPVRDMPSTSEEP